MRVHPLLTQALQHHHVTELTPRQPPLPQHATLLEPARTEKLKGYFFGVNTTGAGKIYWNEDNAFSQPFYALLNAHAGIDFGTVRINVWGKNLTDTDYDAFFFTSAATTRELKFSQRGNPLQIGVDVAIHF